MRSTVLAAIVVAGLGSAVADIEDTKYTSNEWGISLQAPRNWTLSERTSYPNILLWMSRRSPDGKLLLTAEKLGKSTGALSYARKTRVVLRSMGFKVRAPQFHAATGAYWADFDDGRSYLRQAYLIKGDVGFTLTLSAPSQRLRNQHLRAFDTSLRSIEFPEPKKAEDKPAKDGDGK